MSKSIAAMQRFLAASYPVLVSFNHRLYQQLADLSEVARSAGSMDPDLAALWIEGEQRENCA